LVEWNAAGEALFVLMRKRKAEIPLVSEKGFTGGDDLLAIYMPTSTSVGIRALLLLISKQGIVSFWR